MTTGLVAASMMAPLLLLPQGGLLAEAAYLKASFYAEHYGRPSAARTEMLENRQQAGLVGKSTTSEGQKSTTSEANNRPPNHRGMPAKGLTVLGLMSPRELEAMLSKRGWSAWSSEKRMSGLLLLIADAL